jgi:hypothetical protein
LIAGRYEPLADGLARDVELDRVVRLRWIDSVEEVDDPRLSHPNVVRVFDVGTHEGRRFAAVEHVDGMPLALAAPLGRAEAIALGIRAARALGAAHELGLVHRGEILVRPDGVPKLSGFRRGEPGEDVRALAAALNDASPELPPLEADTARALERALERAKPAAMTIPLPTLVLPRLPRRRRRLAVALAALALAALAVGLVAALAGGGGTRPSKPPARTIDVPPVPPGATAQAQAQNLAGWLSRWSSP